MRILTRRHRDPIRHLDFALTCDGAKGTCQRPAKYVVHLHGCANALLCKQCLDNDLEWAAGLPTIKCDYCGRESDSLLGLATVSLL
ncbi:hypothetical protein [Nocardia sp. NPDC060249]|uniref:hypothetical protein n=1 Tax=Nocardia sp. NPDC060249 TaxID=3347082 RepID=UPI00365E7015